MSRVEDHRVRPALGLGSCWCRPNTPRENHKLWAAVRRGQLDKVKRALARGADINAADPSDYQRTSLHMACSAHSSAAALTLVEALLQNGADVRVVDGGGSSPLHLAVVGSSSNTTVVNTLLSRGASVAALTKTGASVLHVAAAQGTAEVVRLLLSHYADTALWDKDQHTPLQKALVHQNMATAYELLKVESWLGEAEWAQVTAALLAEFPTCTPLRVMIEDLGPRESDPDTNSLVTPPTRRVLNRDQAALQVASSTTQRVVEIARRRDGAFGFNIYGGREFNMAPSILTKKETPPSYTSGSAQYGDEVREINGSMATGYSHAELVAAVQGSGAVVRLTLLPAPGGFPFIGRRLTQLLCDPTLPSFTKDMVVRKMGAAILTTEPVSPRTVGAHVVSEATFLHLLDQGLLQRYDGEDGTPFLYGLLKRPNLAVPSIVPGSGQRPFTNGYSLARVTSLSATDPGFSLEGGVEQRKLVLLSGLKHVAQRDVGTRPLQEGDALLAVNGCNVAGMSCAATRAVLAACAVQSPDVELLVMHNGTASTSLAELKSQAAASPEMTLIVADIRDIILASSVPYTTRPPRAGEVDGQDYYFVTEAQFVAARDRDELFESGEREGIFYGTKWTPEEVVARPSSCGAAVGMSTMHLPGLHRVVHNAGSAGHVLSGVVAREAGGRGSTAAAAAATTTTTIAETAAGTGVGTDLGNELMQETSVDGPAGPSENAAAESLKLPSLLTIMSPPRRRSWEGESGLGTVSGAGSDSVLLLPDARTSDEVGAAKDHADMAITKSLGADADVPASSAVLRTKTSPKHESSSSTPSTRATVTSLPSLLRPQSSSSAVEDPLTKSVSKAALSSSRPSSYALPPSSSRPSSFVPSHVSSSHTVIHTPSYTAISSPAAPAAGSVTASNSSISSSAHAASATLLAATAVSRNYSSTTATAANLHAPTAPSASAVAPTSALASVSSIAGTAPAPIAVIESDAALASSTALSASTPSPLSEDSETLEEAIAQAMSEMGLGAMSPTKAVAPASSVRHSLEATTHCDSAVRVSLNDAVRETPAPGPTFGPSLQLKASSLSLGSPSTNGHAGSALNSTNIATASVTTTTAPIASSASTASAKSSSASSDSAMSQKSVASPATGSSASINFGTGATAVPVAAAPISSVVSALDADGPLPSVPASPSRSTKGSKVCLPASPSRSKESVLAASSSALALANGQDALAGNGTLEDSPTTTSSAFPNSVFLVHSASTPSTPHTARASSSATLTVVNGHSFDSFASHEPSPILIPPPTPFSPSLDTTVSSVPEALTRERWTMLRRLRRALGVRMEKLTSENGFIGEFRKVCVSTESIPVSSVTAARAHPSLNRYVDIPVFDQSRVVLQPFDIAHPHDYINASYVDVRRPRRYIATQGPLRHTVFDFWRMVWQEGARVVLMLSERFEDGKEKVACYWPEKIGVPKVYGPFRAELVTETVEDVVLRTIRLTCDAFPDDVRTVHQLQCLTWQDHSVASEQMVLGLRARAHALAAQSPGHRPIIVHCSAGVGRTGCFLVTDAIISAIEDASPSLTPEEMASLVDIPAATTTLRRARPRLVQTSGQYELVYWCVLKWLDMSVATKPLPPAEE